MISIGNRGKMIRIGNRGKLIGGAKTDKVIGRRYPEINKDKSRGEGKKNMGNGISGD